MKKELLKNNKINIIKYLILFAITIINIIVVNIYFKEISIDFTYMNIFLFLFFSVIFIDIKKHKLKQIFVSDLNIYDIWEDSNKDLFIKMTNEHSISIGSKGKHSPSDMWKLLDSSLFIKPNNNTPVKKVGKLQFNSDI